MTLLLLTIIAVLLAIIAWMWISLPKKVDRMKNDITEVLGDASAMEELIKETNKKIK